MARAHASTSPPDEGGRTCRAEGHSRQDPARPRRLPFSAARSAARPVPRACRCANHFLDEGRKDLADGDRRGKAPFAERLPSSTLPVGCADTRVRRTLAERREDIPELVDYLLSWIRCRRRAACRGARSATTPWPSCNRMTGPATFGNCATTNVERLRLMILTGGDSDAFTRSMPKVDMLPSEIGALVPASRRNGVGSRGGVAQSRKN